MTQVYIQPNWQSVAQCVARVGEEDLPQTGAGDGDRVNLKTVRCSDIQHFDQAAITVIYTDLECISRASLHFAARSGVGDVGNERSGFERGNQYRQCRLTCQG